MDSARFWSKVVKGPSCWEWTGARLMGRGGRTYGRIKRHGRGGYAHRVAWELAYGPIPHGLYVCHTCDNPPCVRPDHLFLGTNRDNQRDASAKGRSASKTPGIDPLAQEKLRDHPELRARGERNGNVRLTADQVREIRAAVLTERQQAVADRFGVSNQLVSAIKRREVWRHIP